MNEEVNLNFHSEFIEFYKFYVTVLMKYRNTKKAVFLKRPNRFTAHVLVDGREEVVHVKNTGRCKEILIEGVEVILEESLNTDRKTKYSLIAGYKGDMLINIDSQVPNGVIFDALKAGEIEDIRGVKHIKREVTFGNSRFDIYFERENSKGFIEVKGATLEIEGVAKFPDAPTERGTKHIYEMIKAVERGYEGYILFLVQIEGIGCFMPHEVMDIGFAQALKLAGTKGVKVIAYNSHVKEDEIILGHKIEVKLE